MKVGRIILMTAIMLSLSTLAVAGPDPCPPPDSDLDLDGICDSVDNCPPSVPNHPLGVANASQLDSDGDGRGDVCDNCVSLDNGPLVFAPSTGSVSQCDRDGDGFGNACNSDLNNNGSATATDNPIYIATPVIPPVPKNADMNCDGFKTALDNVRYLASLMVFRGPSGWACAPAGFIPAVDNSCMPLP